jgi:hypothetical protein
MIFFMANPYFVCRTISPDPRFKVKPFLGRIAHCAIRRRATSTFFPWISLTPVVLLSCAAPRASSYYLCRDYVPFTP